MQKVERLAVLWISFYAEAHQPYAEAHLASQGVLREVLSQQKGRLLLSQPLNGGLPGI